MANEVRLAEAASGGDPAEGLRAARALRELAERLETLQVGNARAHGWSWAEIAFFLGGSKQAVHKKRAGRRSPVGDKARTEGGDTGCSRGSLRTRGAWWCAPGTRPCAPARTGSAASICCWACWPSRARPPRR